MKRMSAVVVLCFALFGAAAAFADDLAPPAQPESVGFSAERLERITAWHRARVEALTPSDPVIPGAVVAIARDGKLAYLQAVGFQDRAKTIPMKADSIFWIASMTKPITCVAAMILVDAGKLDLDAPVARYLPRLGAMQVAREDVDAKTGERRFALEPPRRPMIVRDLMRHTSGLVYPGMDFADPGGFGEEIHERYGRVARFKADDTLADFVDSLADLPLAHQPGEVWEYSWSVDVLARVVEVASGEPFDRFLQAHVVRPAAHGRHRILRRAGQAFALGRLAGGGAIPRIRHQPAAPIAFRRRRTRPRPRWITCASARCCSMAANSTARACCRRKRSPK